MTAANVVKLKMVPVTMNQLIYFVKETQLMKKVFAFFASSDNNVLATNEVDIIIDSGCTNYMLKDRELFATLDESFSGSVGCANHSESKIKGKGRADFYLCEDNGKRAKITLTEAFCSRLREELNFSEQIEKFW